MMIVGQVYKLYDHFRLFLSGFIDRAKILPEYLKQQKIPPYSPFVSCSENFHLRQHGKEVLQILRKIQNFEHLQFNNHWVI